MKGSFKFYLLLSVLSFVFLVSCQKQVDYGPDIALLKSDVASMKSSISSLTAQLTALDASLKTKIDITNSRIDTINASLVTLTSKTLLDLSTNIKDINASIKNTNEANKKTLDSLKIAILSVDSSLIYISTTSPSVLTNSYNKILTNYIGILQIVKSTLAVVQIDGSVFKGSFLRGSLLFFYELDNNLNQSGRSFNTTIEDDYGNFSLNAQNLSGKLVRVIGDGFYWNEVINENSSTRITLTGICKIDSNETVNVNVLTHLERPRVEYLYKYKGLSFDSAKSKAITEVLSAFGFTNTGVRRAEKVGIFGIGEESKILLAISTMMQGYRTESEVTTLLNDFAEDLKKDGTLDDITIGNDIASHNFYLDTTLVVNNVKAKFSKIYNSDTISTLNLSYLNTFNTKTTYIKDKDLIYFPKIDPVYNYPNLLNESNTTITGGAFSPSCTISRKGIKLKAELVNEDGSAANGYDFGFTLQGLWIVSRPNVYVPTFTSTSLGDYSTQVSYSNRKKYRLNIYYNDMVKPKVSRYVTLN